MLKTKSILISANFTFKPERIFKKSEWEQIIKEPNDTDYFPDPADQENDVADDDCVEVGVGGEQLIVFISILNSRLLFTSTT